MTAPRNNHGHLREGKPSLKIIVASRADMDRNLEEGVALLQKMAEQQGTYQGIMATRHSPSEFTLELRPEIPFGTIREKQY